MMRDKSPGLKILWLWTFGTAAIMITNVVRTRVKDMEKLMNDGQEQQQQVSSTDLSMTDTFGENDEHFQEDKS